MAKRGGRFRFGRVERKEEPKAAPSETVTPVSSAPEEDSPPPALALGETHPLRLLWNVSALEAGLEFRPPPPEPALGFPADGAASALPAEEDPAREVARLDRFLAETAGARLARYREAGGTGEKDLPPRTDAEAHVFVTAKRMAAYYVLFPPMNGGRHVTREDLSAALDAAGVSFGVDEEYFESSFSPEGRYFRLLPAARGRSPVDGRDGYVIDLFSRETARTLREDESGRVDFAAESLFQSVKKDEAICRIVPPGECEDGRDVTGRTVCARAGRAATVPMGRNTRISEDGTSLVAACEGHVEFSGRSFQVKHVLDVGGSVDFSTGNINCLGDVHIFGDVCSGFTVRATGTITVDGVVEASTVEAGMDLVVRKGVQGNNQAVLRAHRNIQARYLESCQAYAREDLVAETIINCNIYSDGSVTVRSGRGAVIGGEIRAARIVSANIVGVRTEQPTRVCLGGRPCEEFEREGLVREIGEMELQLEKLDRQPDSPMKLRQMSKVRVRIAADKMKLRQMERALEELEKEDAEDLRGLRLECSTLYPGVEISIGSQTLRVDRECAMCAAALRDGEITLYK